MLKQCSALQQLHLLGCSQPPGVCFSCFFSRRKPHEAFSSLRLFWCILRQSKASNGALCQGVGVFFSDLGLQDLTKEDFSLGNKEACSSCCGCSGAKARNPWYPLRFPCDVQDVTFRRTKKHGGFSLGAATPQEILKSAGLPQVIVHFSDGQVRACDL